MFVDNFEGRKPQARFWLFPPAYWGCQAWCVDCPDLRWRSEASSDSDLTWSCWDSGPDLQPPSLLSPLSSLFLSVCKQPPPGRDKHDGGKFQEMDE